MPERIKGLRMVNADFIHMTCDLCEHLEYSPRYVLDEAGTPVISRMQAHCQAHNKEIYAKVFGCLEFKERVETEGV